MNGYPGPFKCPDCGTWWAGFQHRCLEPRSQIGSNVGVPTKGNVTVDGTVRCTCPPDRGDMYAGTCPIHDVRSTYTEMVPHDTPRAEMPQWVRGYDDWLRGRGVPRMLYGSVDTLLTEYRKDT